jgi:hypothetical protein
MRRYRGSEKAIKENMRDHGVSGHLFPGIEKYSKDLDAYEQAMLDIGKENALNRTTRLLQVRRKASPADTGRRDRVVFGERRAAADAIS